MDGMLAGQKALITGASSGIGRAVALAMADAGAEVVVNYLGKTEQAAEVVATIEERGGRAFAHRADVSSEDQVQRMVQRVVEQLGTVDILVANAGLERNAPFEVMSLEEWQQVIDVNLTGQFLCAREVVREFKRRGVVQSVSSAAGKIISISSVHDRIPWAGHVNYAASKAGTSMLVKSLALELAPARIRVNAISPGAIRTGINRQAWDTAEAADQLRQLIPYDRIGEPEEVARAAVWLASDQADYVTGATLYLDGGMSLYPGFAHGG